MSAVVETILFCDYKLCNAQFGVDNRERTVSEQRLRAKANGWRSIAGLDFCPECKDKAFPVEEEK